MAVIKELKYYYLMRKKKDVGALLSQVELIDSKAIQERTMDLRVLSYLFVSSPVRMTT